MLGINVVAVAVAAVVACVASLLWYLVFGKELAKVSDAFAKGMQQRQPWKMLVVIVQSLVLALVLAYVLGLLGKIGWLEAVGVGIVLWIGLSAVQWVGSMLWENVPVKMAAIHAGDWLVKLVLIAGIVGVWH